MMRKKKYKSIFVKNFYSVILLLVFLAIFAVAMCYYFYRSMEIKELENGIMQETDMLVNQWEVAWDENNLNMFHIASYRDTILFLSDKNLTQITYRMSDVERILSFAVHTKPYVKSAYLQGIRNGYVLTQAGRAKYESSEAKPYIELWNESEKGQKLLFYAEGDQKDPLGLLYRPVNDNGLIILKISLSELCETLVVDENLNFCLNVNGQIMLSNDKSLLGKRADELKIYNECERDIISAWGRYVVEHRVLDEQTEILTWKDKGIYLENLNRIITVIAGVCLTLIVFMLFFSIHIARKVSLPVRVILQMLERDSVQKEDLSMINVREVEYIRRIIYEKQCFASNIEKELEERIYLLKKAQIVALQAQINPHFLNNTLDTINWTAVNLLGLHNPVSVITESLSQMLGMNLDNYNMLISMQQEIEHCKHYLKIQEKRHEGRFMVEWNIDECLMKCKTIPIVLQPIVENAFSHGILQLSEACMITIRGTVDGNDVVIQVIDNGVGMEAEKVEEVMKDIDSVPIKEKDKIGLRNVHQRIKLFFGDDYGVKIESQRWLGTTVFIRFPFYTDFD